VSPSSEYLRNAPNYWSPNSLTTLPPSKHSWTNRGKIINASHTNFYAVTEPNFAKFLRCVEKWLPINILKSKLWYSNHFWNASVLNEWWSSNYGRVAAKFQQSPFVNSEVTQPMLTKFLHNVQQLPLLLMHAIRRRYCIPFQNARAKSEGGQFRRPQKPPNLSVAIATSLGLRQTLCQINNRHTRLPMLKKWRKSVENLLRYSFRYAVISGVTGPKFT